MDEWEGSGVVAVPGRVRRFGKQRVEKGVDVKLAVDFVAMALDDEFDVGIIFSADGDFVPALQLVATHQRLDVTTEVAGWWVSRHRNEMLNVHIGSKQLWQHRLTETAYHHVRDQTNYSS